MVNDLLTTSTLLGNEANISYEKCSCGRIHSKGVMCDCEINRLVKSSVISFSSELIEHFHRMVKNNCKYLFTSEDIEREIIYCLEQNCKGE